MMEGSDRAPLACRQSVFRRALVGGSERAEEELLVVVTTVFLQLQSGRGCRA